MEESISSHVLLLNKSNEYAMYLAKVCKGAGMHKLCVLTCRNETIKSFFLFQPDNTFSCVFILSSGTIVGRSMQKLVGVMAQNCHLLC